MNRPAAPTLFVYWRTADADAALAAARRWLETVRQVHAGVDARLYRRRDDSGAGCTLMETYAHAHGLDAALQAALLAGAAAALGRWCDGARHVEVFDAVD